MSLFNETIANELKQHGIEFIHFVDISGLAEKQNRGFSSAVLFGVKCSVWQSGMEREEMIDVEKYTTCLKCMVHCPSTQRCMNKEVSVWEI